MSTLTLHGSRWVTVRQHRSALRGGLALLIAALVVVIGVRWWEAAAFDRAFCLEAADTERCSTGPWGHMAAQETLRLTAQYGSVAMLLLPLLAAAFVAGPMVARELESGTWRLAWTQSVTPARWLASKLSVAAAAIVFAAMALLGIYRIIWSPVADSHNLTWADRGVFEGTGPVVVAYCLLAVAVGALVGQLIRRTVPAMSAAGLVTGAVVMVLGSLRWHWLPVKTVLSPLAGEPPVASLPRNTFVTDTGRISADGLRHPEHICWERTGDPEKCPADLNITSQFADYHPYSHFWLTQLIETGIVLVLTAAAAYTAFRLLRSRHA
ncbi:ABC transporter permease subunit [Streptomyces xantholiticus]|uniref:ABC transporter permease subunit n=1 Tax=Streptomyces xantholiticus TaxID=68285 RepID=A0ABV1UVD1_9ACTN